jgi:hypothetical protein
MISLALDFGCMVWLCALLLKSAAKGHMSEIAMFQQSSCASSFDIMSTPEGPYDVATSPRGSGHFPI